VDPIFDRLGDLFKSFFQEDEGKDDYFGGAQPGHRASGDPDLDAAYDELNDFLNKDMGETERRARDQQRKAQQSTGSASTGHNEKLRGQATPPGPHPGLLRDYKTIGVPFGSKLAEVKTAYKKILIVNHPDRHAKDPEAMKRATTISSSVNAAYQRIETWLATGKYEA
jgi:DnaJ-domain-containing protein 1